jgi:hypothetical protein
VTVLLLGLAALMAVALGYLHPCHACGGSGRARDQVVW